MKLLVLIFSPVMNLKIIIYLCITSLNCLVKVNTISKASEIKVNGACIELQ